MQHPQWSFLSKEGKQVSEDPVLGIYINSLWENYATAVAFLLSNYDLNILIYICSIYILGIYIHAHILKTFYIKHTQNSTQPQFANMHAYMQFEPGCMCLSSFCHPVTQHHTEDTKKSTYKRYEKSAFK